MAQARESLRGQWGTAVGGVIIYLLVSILIGFLPIINFFIGGPLIFGLVYFSLTLSKADGTANVSDVFYGFNYIGQAILAILLTGIIVVLGAILLIIPGIVATFALSMTFFILSENPQLGAWGAIKHSNEIMRGNKWKFFCLYFRFLGWIILCFCTFGIGFLWLIPYMIVSFAKFYQDITQQKSSEPVDSQKSNNPLTQEVSGFESISDQETIVESPQIVPITLNVDNGPRKGSFFNVSKPSRIGRAPDNDIPLNDNTVSSYHAEIFLKDNQFYIKDMDSTNGTKVNGERVSEAPLVTGTKLIMGETELTIG